MRSTFAGLNTMVRGIQSNQLSLDTVLHNITNANTDGYSRQSVNLAATRGQNVSSLYGEVIVGTGVDSTSIERARNVYADKQYWSENSTNQYYKTQQTNYDKIESIFNDSDSTGILNSLNEFYNAIQDLSTGASTDSNRVAVIEKGNTLVDKIKTTSSQMQDQINAQYDDMRLAVQTINNYTDQIVELNKNIMSTEASGGTANDLRDQRDLLVDNLSKYINLNVYEDESTGMYSVVSNGISLVNGVSSLTLEMSDPIANKTYGINDYSINIKESGVAYVPSNGTLAALQATITEDKGYIDDMADVAGFMLTTFNHMHQQGAGIDGADSSLGSWTDNSSSTYAGPTYGINFFGEQNTQYVYNDETGKVDAYVYVDGSVTRSLGYTEEKASDGTVTRTPVVSISGTMSTDDPEELDGINIINALGINKKITAAGGENLIAARTLSVTQNTSSTGAQLSTYSVTVNGTGDGTNATNLETLLNMDRNNVAHTAMILVNSKQTDGTVSTEAMCDTLTDAAYAKLANGGTTAAYTLYTYDSTNQTNTSASTTATLANTERTIDKISLQSYYNSMMSHLGADSETVDDKQDAQDDLITQITAWRSSTSGVDWNEELTNMIRFQQGYSACSRCLTTMDEMLDKLINSTGTVGR